MTSIIFPTSPTVDQEFMAGDRIWVWTGAVWNSAPQFPVSTLVSETKPLNVPVGTKWFKSSTTQEFIFFDSVWIEL